MPIKYTKIVANVKKSWNIIAEHYNRKYEISCDNIHYGPLCPGEAKLSLLGDMKGLRVIDLGCGGGQNAVALSKMGAEVTAIDFSGKQIKQAELLAKLNNVDIDFQVSDIESLSSFESQSFDIAISACAISFVKNIKRAFKGVHRILKSSAIFALSDMNPLQYILDETDDGVMFNTPYPQKPLLLKWSWEFEAIKRSPGFQHYVRPISAYHNSLVDAGFMVRKMLEPKSTMNTPHKGFSKEIIDEYGYIAKNIPITFILLCQKP